ncbi:hypothetical protein HDU91_007072 [Kappamyces sp. JEL0680]|nr:hypothetical protein HDU91_007072 [Kappamyces sp. JEL0680]
MPLPMTVPTPESLDRNMPHRESRNSPCKVNARVWNGLAASSGREGKRCSTLPPVAGAGLKTPAAEKLHHLAAATTTTTVDPIQLKKDVEFLCFALDKMLATKSGSALHHDSNDWLFERIYRLFLYANLDKSLVLVSLLYIARVRNAYISHLHSAPASERLTIFDCFVSALILGQKMNSDSFYSLSSWSKLAGIVPNKIRASERLFLSFIDGMCGRPVRLITGRLFVNQNHYSSLQKALRDLACQFHPSPVAMPATTHYATPASFEASGMAAHHASRAVPLSFV